VSLGSNPLTAMVRCPAGGEPEATAERIILKAKAPWHPPRGLSLLRLPLLIASDAVTRPLNPPWPAVPFVAPNKRPPKAGGQSLDRVVDAAVRHLSRRSHLYHGAGCRS
jgi:hypothetical protein